MRIALGSAFRNSMRNGQFYRWVAQASALQQVLASHGHTFSVIMAEGDSTDATNNALVSVLLTGQLQGKLVDVTHGGPVFGSTEAPERMRALQGVGNGILSGVDEDVDVLIYVESDLVWDTSEILALIERLSQQVDVVAPLVYAGEHFYDVFAFRALDGARFSPFPPYSHAFEQGSLAEIRSAGSCLVMKGAVARSCRISEEEGLVSFCADARRRGFRIWADSVRRVDHP